MVRRQQSNDKKMFFNTILEMRKLISKYQGGYAKDTMGLNKVNIKVPYNHLMGRRKQLKEKYAHEKSRAREEAVQYDSSMKLLNSEIMESKKEKD